MIIDCISDLHGHEPLLEGGDLLLLCGDYTVSGKMFQWVNFFSWLKKQKYRKKILIAGNHDNLFESGFQKNEEESDTFKNVNQYLEGQEDFEYLCDSGTQFEGIKIWGSPWTPTFMNWHFMKNRGPEIKEKWDLIPKDTEILVTHGPAYGILDRSRKKSVGCEELRSTVERIQPAIHVFGHIHEDYGVVKLKGVPKNTICINCSVLDGSYDLKNKAIRIDRF